MDIYGLRPSRALTSTFRDMECYSMHYGIYGIESYGLLALNQLNPSSRI